MAFRREKFVPPRRPVRRGRRPRRRRPAWRLRPEPQHAGPLPLQPGAQGTSAAGHGLGSNLRRPLGGAHRAAGPRGHGALRRLTRGSCSTTSPHAGESKWSSRSGGRVADAATSTSPPAPTRPRASTSLAAAGEERHFRLELQAARRRRAGRLPERGEVHADLPSCPRPGPRWRTTRSPPSSRTWAWSPIGDFPHTESFLHRGRPARPDRRRAPGRRPRARSSCKPHRAHQRVLVHLVDVSDGIRPAGSRWRTSRSSPRSSRAFDPGARPDAPHAARRRQDRRRQSGQAEEAESRGVAPQAGRSSRSPAVTGGGHRAR